MRAAAPMSATTTAMGAFYDEERASSQLRSYRRKGPIPSTRALIMVLVAEGVEGATLLDIGGGIGAIQHELLDAGLLMRPASMPPLPTWMLRGRKAGDAGTGTGSHTSTATSSTWPTQSRLPRS